MDALRGSYTRFLSASITEHHYYCQRLVLTCLNLGQSLVGHSLSLCSISVRVYHVGRTYFRSKVLYMVAVLAFPLRVLPGYRKWPLQDQCVPLVGVSVRVTPMDLSGASLSQVSGMSWR